MHLRLTVIVIAPLVTASACAAVAQSLPLVWLLLVAASVAVFFSEMFALVVAAAVEMVCVW